jgi:hypothetical protein
MRGLRVRVGVAAVAALAALISGAPAALAQAQAARPATAHSTSITLNGTALGAVFQGAGAVSGGGGNSRLLIDYPAKWRQQILDYLFKPGFGADLQVLKIEIGGDAYATDGAEPSIEQTEGQINCQAGYELWLAQQARKLNPNIVLYGLQWNAPGWVTGNADGWSTADIHYLIDWLNCAKQDGLTINYLGGWNERLPKQGITPQIMQWFINLRAALNAAGYSSVKLIAADSFARLSGGDVADALAGHPKFAQAISALGYHNLCKYPSTGNNCTIPAAARTSGKQIWESEIGALRQGTAVDALARSLINAFVQVGATGMLEWPLVSSMPANLPEEDRGLIFAEEPWSGQYQVNLMAWVMAQTTEFTEPGWRHLVGGSGSLGGNWGTYTSYDAPRKAAWSMVVQTTQAPRDQVISVHVANSLPGSAVHVWTTNLNSTRSSTWFYQHTPVRLSGRSFRYTLRPGFLYTFTTTTGQKKGTYVGPASQPMPLPYTATQDASGEPNWLGPEDGSFQYPSPTSTTFQQTTVNQPMFWQNDVSTRFPYAVVGDTTFANYTVSAQVSFTASGQTAGLISRFDHPKANGIAEHFQGYQFIVAASGAWQLLRDSATGSPATLASGTLASAPGVNNPVTLSLSSQGSQLTPSVNGTALKTVTDATYATGDAGISTGGWYPVNFGSLTVTK